MNVDFLFYMQSTHVEVWYFFQCTRKVFSEADPHRPALGSPEVSEKLSCDM